MSSITKKITRHIILDVLGSASGNQINLASLSARENLADSIVDEISKRVKMSIHVSRPVATDKTITVDMEETIED